MILPSIAKMIKLASVTFMASLIPVCLMIPLYEPTNKKEITAVTYSNELKPEILEIHKKMVSSCRRLLKIMHHLFVF